jgi:CRP/FNR family nitrogen fixation transcriptional regulator
MMLNYGARELIQAGTLPLPMDEDIAELLRHATLGPVSFHPANAMIYAQGEAAGPLYYVEFGTVRVCQMAPDGRRQIAAFYSAGQVFGFEPDDVHLFYAESVDGAGIRSLRPKMQEGAAGEVLKVALRGLIAIQSHLMMTVRLGAAERLAVFLLDMMERQGSEDSVALQMQRTDIGDYLGLTFETVSRVFRVLKDGGLINLPTPDRVKVISKEGLERFCAV